MQITGYKLREAIRAHELKSSMYQKQFEDTLKAFPGEVKEAPVSVMEKFAASERAVARLQAAQASYNIAIVIDVLGERMTLCEGIKRVGSAGRIEKLWRVAAGGAKKKEGYSYSRDTSGDVRKKDEERSTATMSQEEAGKLANKAARFAGALRAAIAVANGTPLDVKDLEPSLLE